MKNIFAGLKKVATTTSITGALRLEKCLSPTMIMNSSLTACKNTCLTISTSLHTVSSQTTFHLFVRVKTEHELPIKKRINTPLTNQFRKLFISHARRMNKYGDKHGQIFCTPFKRIEITDDAYFTQVVYYIHCNPVHHEITKHPADYKYSSFHAYTSSRPTKIENAEVLEWFWRKRIFHQVS
jgi:hypothetical protein